MRKDVGSPDTQTQRSDLNSQLGQNANRVSINIYQVHEKELQNHYTNELDLPYDVLNTNQDIFIQIYYTKTLTSMQKRDLLYLIDSENNKEHFVYIKGFNKLMGSNGKHNSIVSIVFNLWQRR